MKYTLSPSLRYATFAVMAVVSLAAAAQPATSEKRSGPPEEAIAACKSLQAGKDCSFTGMRGNVTGTCFAPQGKPLACRPKDAPEKRQSKATQP